MERGGGGTKENAILIYGINLNLNLTPLKKTEHGEMFHSELQSSFDAITSLFSEVQGKTAERNHKLAVCPFCLSAFLVRLGLPVNAFESLHLSRRSVCPCYSVCVVEMWASRSSCMSGSSCVSLCQDWRKMKDLMSKQSAMAKSRIKIDVGGSIKRDVSEIGYVSEIGRFIFLCHAELRTMGA